MQCRMLLGCFGGFLVVDSVHSLLHHHPADDLPHLLQDRYDLVKGWPLARVLVHADLDELGHVGGEAGGDVDAEALGGDLRRE